MAERGGVHPLGVVLLAFAASLMACGVAGIVAWQRCGAGDSCSSELAISVLGLAPAALLFSIMLLLIASRLSGGRSARAAIALAVGVAVLPLVAFTMDDLTRSAIAAVLVSALAYSLLSRSDELVAGTVSDPREEITLIEQTRAMHISRPAPLPAPPPPIVDGGATALPASVDELRQLQRAAALLDRALVLQQRADALILALPPLRAAQRVFPNAEPEKHAARAQGSAEPPGERR